ncbi:uncharacterized protein LOC116619103 isoform X2 [Nematostella vectensis]|uniref:uncharacterized protein LOC116619103 isoform X2 n=1 Tax=Nematostella vectensis TaxID=45351 RepID=UPI002077844D|nr:uncharacterized protein LOC116619103 isoform X2 [Nematostella vectensis]
MIWLIVSSVLGTILGIAKYYFFPELDLFYLPRLISGHTWDAALLIAGGSPSDRSPPPALEYSGSEHSTHSTLPWVETLFTGSPVELTPNTTALTSSSHSTEITTWLDSLVWGGLVTITAVAMVTVTIYFTKWRCQENCDCECASCKRSRDEASPAQPELA